MVTSAKIFFANSGSNLAHKLEVTILSGFTTINLRKSSAWLSSSHKIRHQRILSFSLKGCLLEKAQEDRDVCEQPSGEPLEILTGTKKGILKITQKAVTRNISKH